MLSPARPTQKGQAGKPSPTANTAPKKKTTYLDRPFLTVPSNMLKPIPEEFVKDDPPLQSM